MIMMYPILHILQVDQYYNSIIVCTWSSIMRCHALFYVTFSYELNIYCSICIISAIFEL